MEIIPAIDIIDGKCVRLTQGDYSRKTVYNEDPLEVAKMFEGHGITRLHLVDLDGARQGMVVNFHILETIASKTDLVIDFGGGIKTDADIETVFNYGAHIATLGSIAVKQPEKLLEWLQTYGSDKLLLGADVKNENIAISGWLEETEINVLDFLRKMRRAGIRQVFCTDVSKDGNLQGPSIQLYKKIINENPELDFIASGGVATIQDLVDLQKIGCSGAIVGKAIYEGRITMKELMNFIKDHAG